MKTKGSVLNTKIENVVLEDGFSKKTNLIYCKRINEVWSAYLVLDQRQSQPIHSVGVINQHINEIMYKLGKLAVGPSVVKIKAVKHGPPLCIASLALVVQSTSKNDERPINPQSTSSLTLEHSLNLANSFYKKYSNINAAVDFSIANNKFFQAQGYCIPIALKMLRDQVRFDSYVSDWSSNLKFDLEKRQYARYISLVQHEVF